MPTALTTPADVLQIPGQRARSRGLLRRPRRPADPKVFLLASLGLFQGVSRQVLESLCPIVEHLDLPAGHELLTEGAFAREAFLLVDGVAEARLRGQRLGEARTGELLGDLALLSSGRAPVTWVAVTDVVVLSLAPRELHELLRRCPIVADRVHGLAETPSNIVVRTV